MPDFGTHSKRTAAANVEKFLGRHTFKDEKVYRTTFLRT